MKAFNVYQIQLTDEQIDRVNLVGWNSEFKAYMDATYLLHNEVAGEKVHAAMDFMQFTATIFVNPFAGTSEALEQIFAELNGMPTDCDVTFRKERSKSMSIGDVAVDADTLEAYVVCNFGFEKVDGLGEEIQKFFDAKMRAEIEAGVS